MKQVRKCCKNASLCYILFLHCHKAVVRHRLRNRKRDLGKKNNELGWYCSRKNLIFCLVNASKRTSLNLLSRPISTRGNLNKIIYYSERNFEITRGSNVKFDILKNWKILQFLKLYEFNREEYFLFFLYFRK